eukprot:1160007-Pelagomonas_calceolata.AAC.3
MPHSRWEHCGQAHCSRQWQRGPAFWHGVNQRASGSYDHVRVHIMAEHFVGTTPSLRPGTSASNWLIMLQNYLVPSSPRAFQQHQRIAHL